MSGTLDMPAYDGGEENEEDTWRNWVQRRGLLWEVDFFLLRTALKGRSKGPPTANHGQPPAATDRHQPPITNQQPPPTSTNRHQPLVTNRQPPTTNRESPPSMVEHMSYMRFFCKTAVQEHPPPP